MFNGEKQPLRLIAYRLTQELVGLTTYFEEPSCTTLASVTSNNKLSVNLLPVGEVLAPLTPLRLLQLS